MQTIKLSLQPKIFKQTKVQNHKVVNSKPKIGIIIARNFSIYSACYHMKIDGNKKFSKLLTEHRQYLLKSDMSYPVGLW